MVPGGRAQRARGAAVEPSLDAGAAYHGRVVLADDLEARRRLAIASGEPDPELEDARPAGGLDRLVVDDAATGGHPDDVASAERALVTVVQGPLQHERDGLEPGVGVRPADGAAERDVEPVVHEQHERIARAQIAGRHHLDGGVPLADEPGRGGRCGHDPGERSRGRRTFVLIFAGVPVFAVSSVFPAFAHGVLAFAP